MERAQRACAILTGSVASVSVAISLVWWVDPEFGYRAANPVVVLVFLTGLCGFFVMFGMLFGRLRGGMGGWPFARISLPRPVLVRLAAVLVWLVFVLVLAVVSAVIAAGQVGEWGVAAPYSWGNCHWPLSADHDTKHMCVSHARWLEVNLQTAHIFVGFGALFCTIDCVAFTALSRFPRPPAKPAVLPRLHGDTS